MEGRSGKRVGVARSRARENAAVCRREREEKTRRAYRSELHFHESFENNKSGCGRPARASETPQRCFRRGGRRR